MKIVVAGTRGIPGIQGGVETVCEQLYPLLARQGFDITVIRRSHYADTVAQARGLTEWNGVRLVDIPAPHRKSLEAIVHTFRAVIKARRLGADILHIHAVGPAIMVPLARLLGLKVVMTNHGPDYDRAKWGGMARRVLRLGERLGSRWANAVIAISPHIAGIILDNYRREAIVIPNGVPEAVIPPDADSQLSALSPQLKPRRYILAVGRFVPEKGFHLLIRTFSRLQAEHRIGPDTHLVIAGDADHPSEYSRSLKTLAAETPSVVLTGFIKGAPLQSLLSRAALFAMPSSHEGLPIALLEAMSYGLDVATSDIPSCLIPELDDSDHFHLDMTDDATSIANLADLLAAKLAHPATPRAYNMTRYSWPAVAQATADLYRSLTN